MALDLPSVEDPESQRRALGNSPQHSRGTHFVINENDLPQRILHSRHPEEASLIISVVPPYSKSHMTHFNLLLKINYYNHKLPT